MTENGFIPNSGPHQTHGASEPRLGTRQQLTTVLSPNISVFSTKNDSPASYD